MEATFLGVNFATRRADPDVPEEDEEVRVRLVALRRHLGGDFIDLRPGAAALSELPDGWTRETWVTPIAWRRPQRWYLRSGDSRRGGPTDLVALFARARPVLTAAEKAQLDSEGYVLLPGILSADEVVGVRAALEKLAAGKDQEQLLNSNEWLTWWLDRAPRVLSPGYAPTREDLLRLRRRTMAQAGRMRKVLPYQEGAAV